jgi:hypothetical protein
MKSLTDLTGLTFGRQQQSGLGKNALPPSRLDIFAIFLVQYT